MLSGLKKTKCRNSNQQKRCADYLPSGYAGWRKRIIDRQIMWPEREQQVFRIRHERVRQPECKWSMHKRAYRSPIRLLDESDSRGRRHESKQRDLLDNKLLCSLPE